MKIHEYQAKEILRRYSVAVPQGGVAGNVPEAVLIAKNLGGKVVIKAQIHAGGRGKGGGIHLANNPEEMRETAGRILGMTLVTHQTGPEGRLVKKVLVEKASDIARELYLGITLDRSKGRLTLIASPEGGVEIEKVAAEKPDRIFKVLIDPSAGVSVASARELGHKLNLHDALNGRFIDFVESLYKAYVESDASMAEINPLVVTKGGELLALDAKITIDDNALYRHEDFRGMLDLDEEDLREIEAKKYGLSYISLNGNIGCMVNGAGLAMATMDIIKLSGGEPANFLDVGGSTTKENVTEAFKIILSDAKVRAVLINIFGGIVQCDLVAEAIIIAVKEVHVGVPLVVRLQGTNVEKGRKILEKSELGIIFVENLDEAAKKSVKAAKS